MNNSYIGIKINNRASMIIQPMIVTPLPRVMSKISIFYTLDTYRMPNINLFNLLMIHFLKVNTPLDSKKYVRSE